MHSGLTKTSALRDHTSLKNGRLCGGQIRSFRGAWLPTSEQPGCQRGPQGSCGDRLASFWAAPSTQRASARDLRLTGVEASSDVAFQGSENCYENLSAAAESGSE